MKRILVILSVVPSLALALGSSALAATNPLSGACNVGNGNASQSSLCKDAGGVNSSTTNPVATTLHTVANILALISAIIAVIMIIISGLTLVTSRGNQDSVTQSRNRIIYSVVGLLVIAAAWAIVVLITNHLS